MVIPSGGRPMTRKALIVVDMLHDFLDPSGALYCGDRSREIIPQVRDLIRTHREEGSVIIFAADGHDPNDKEFEKFPPHCVKGTPGAEIIPELDVREEDLLVHKTRYSAFYGTDLEAILQGNGVEEVHLCGVCTSICVMDTASDLGNRDYPMVVHRRAVADFDQEAHAFALKRMESLFGATMMD